MYVVSSYLHCSNFDTATSERVLHSVPQALEESELIYELIHHRELLSLGTLRWPGADEVLELLFQLQADSDQ